MGKPKRNQGRPTQQSKKSKKKLQHNKMKSSDDEEVDDVMAWGKKRQNYYREDQDEYSQMSEQEKQAEEIYKNKYDNYLNDEEAYDIPVQKQKDNVQGKKSFEAEFEQNAEEEQTLPQEYISQELQWVLELFKDLEFYEQNNLLKIYEKLLKSYLTVIISIKELKIPYIQYHPIIPMAVDIKAKITQLMKKLTVKQEEPEIKNKKQTKKNSGAKLNESSEDEDNEDQIDEDDEDALDGEIGDEDQQDSEDQQKWQESEQNLKNKKPKSKQSAYPDHCSHATKRQKQEHKKGIQFYDEMKTTLQQQKKQKKQQKRQQRQQKQKPAFKQIGQNEGRFASQLILKNKGLIKKRKKIQGNSRLKLRKKYEKKKAIHRARSGHFIRENPGRAYQGESNIRTGKIAGVRLK